MQKRSHVLCRRVEKSYRLEIAYSKKGRHPVYSECGIRTRYSLNITDKRITAEAADIANLFYAFQRLRQLSPSAIFADNHSLSKGWSVPQLSIKDYPRYGWRGILVDVSRHFRTVKEMKLVIDSMAMAKLNVLHWHLTDDQGWRPEIKAYPKLTAKTTQYYTGRSP